MAEISAFCGLRYNPTLVKKIEKVVCPPYDVISPEQQNKLHASSRENFIRLILGKAKKGDTSGHNKYTRAGDFLKDAIRKKVFVQDSLPAIYLYEQEYRLAAHGYKRLGFIALLRLEPAGKGVVFPHEKTFCKPKQDRLSLLKATQVNLCPIFGLYDADDAAVDARLRKHAKAKPLYDFFFEGIRNKLWKIEDREFIRGLTQAMADKQIFIADGHHRYEVASLYHRLARKRTVARSRSDYVMMYFCNLRNQGLRVLPTHRVVRNVSQEIISQLPALLENYFKLSPCANLPELLLQLKKRAGRRAFGLFLGANRFYLLDVRATPAKKKPVVSQGDYCYNNLDVVLLHSLVFSKLLKLKKQHHHDADIVYARDEKQAVSLVKSKKYQAAFFMNPPSPREISSIARCFKKMPHKSTYFYPKPVSGLVINMLKKELPVESRE